MKVVVVGSGAAGVHFAWTALDRGHAVELVDVGYPPSAPVAPTASFPTLPDALPDPVEYFLGPEGSQVVAPGPGAKFYGFPPSKAYVFRRPPQFRERGEGFEAVLSFAQGGLAQAWTGGSYEYSDRDLAPFPFEAAGFRRHYATVAERIGIAGERDDLERFSPYTAGYQPPLPLDPHSDLLAARYRTRKDRLNRRGFFLGRSRVATLSRPLGDRGGCTNLGRCLWGCPHEALYGPATTLRALERRDGFRYRPGRMARRVNTDADGTVRGLVVDQVDGAGSETVTGDLYVLAAGAIGTTKVYLESMAARTSDSISLPGLLDNRMAMVPFLTLAMIGKAVETAAYQFHQLAFGLEAERPEENAHGQITALKAASIHPIIQNFPVDLRTALSLFQRIRAGLGVATLWLPDRRDEANIVSLAADRTLVIRYRPSEWHRERLVWAMAGLKSALRRLGAMIPPGMSKVLAPGASIHYGGTLPMTRAGGGHTVTPEGRSRLFPNLAVADAAGFPALPAKNHTFTLMANAVRIAEALL